MLLQSIKLVQTGISSYEVQHTNFCSHFADNVSSYIEFDNLRSAVHLMQKMLEQGIYECDVVHAYLRTRRDSLQDIKEVLLKREGFRQQLEALMA